MSRRRLERRKPDDRTSRPPFGALAHAAMRRRLVELRGHEAAWHGAANVGWVRWQHAEGLHVYAAIRRRPAGLTGELGLADEALDLDDLPLVTGSLQGLRLGRTTLGHCLHGHDRLWSSGGSEHALLARLDWLAQQLQLRLHAVLAGASRRAS